MGFKVNAFLLLALQTTGVLDLKPILKSIKPTSEILYLKDFPADDFMVQLVDLMKVNTELKSHRNKYRKLSTRHLPYPTNPRQ